MQRHTNEISSNYSRATTPPPWNPGVPTLSRFMVGAQNRNTKNWVAPESGFEKWKKTKTKVTQDDQSQPSADTGGERTGAMGGANTKLEEQETLKTEFEDVSLAKKIGQAVALARRAKGLTQSQVGKSIRGGQSRVSDIENGRRSPTADTLEEIASALDLELKIEFVEPN